MLVSQTILRLLLFIFEMAANLGPYLSLAEFLQEDQRHLFVPQLLLQFLDQADFRLELFRGIVL